MINQKQQNISLKPQIFSRHFLTPEIRGINFCQTNQVLWQNSQNNHNNPRNRKNEPTSPQSTNFNRKYLTKTRKLSNLKTSNTNVSLVSQSSALSWEVSHLTGISGFKIISFNTLMSIAEKTLDKEQIRAMKVKGKDWKWVKIWRQLWVSIKVLTYENKKVRKVTRIFTQISTVYLTINPL